jgi:riboflavin biosynthesis pyrimidine reductase
VRLTYEQESAPSGVLTPDLAERYGGQLALRERTVVANFVQTVDGIVAIPDLERSNERISRISTDDRFVMGLLRALADVVLIGSGTFHAAPQSRWRPEGAHPDSTDAFAELRSTLGKPASPRVAVLAGTSGIDAQHPALEEGALVLAPNASIAQSLCASLPAAAQVEQAGDGDLVDVAAAIELLHDNGYEQILSEAGPHVFASMVRAGVVDELFLTISAQLAGRPDNAERYGLVEGAEFLPDNELPLELRSLRIGSYGDLFLRYGLTGT